MTDSPRFRNCREAFWHGFRRGVMDAVTDWRTYAIAMGAAVFAKVMFT